MKEDDVLVQRCGCLRLRCVGKQPKIHCLVYFVLSKVFLVRDDPIFYIFFLNAFETFKLQTKFVHPEKKTCVKCFSSHFFLPLHALHSSETKIWRSCVHSTTLIVFPLQRADEDKYAIERYVVSTNKSQQSSQKGPTLQETIDQGVTTIQEEVRPPRP
jgi:hypothetical protein